MQWLTTGAMNRKFDETRDKDASHRLPISVYIKANDDAMVNTSEGHVFNGHNFTV